MHFDLYINPNQRRFFPVYVIFIAYLLLQHSPNTIWNDDKKINFF